MNFDLDYCAGDNKINWFPDYYPMISTETCIHVDLKWGHQRKYGGRIACQWLLSCLRVISHGFQIQSCVGVEQWVRGGYCGSRGAVRETLVFNLLFFIVNYQELFGAVQITPLSSGYCLGSSNWIIQSHYEKVAYVSGSSLLTTHPQVTINNWKHALFQPLW